MKYMKGIACLTAALVATGMLAACSPNSKEPDTTTTTTVQTEPTVTTTTTQQGTLAASDVIVRSGPGLDYDAIGGISYNEDIVIIGREGDWYRIQFGDTVGYISAQYVDVEDAPNTSEMVEGLKTTQTTTKTTKVTTTTKKGETTTTKKGASTTTKKGETTTTKKGTSTTTVKNDNSTTVPSTGVGEVTTTTLDGDMPLFNEGIPEDVIIDDFDW